MIAIISSGHGIIAKVTEWLMNFTVFVDLTPNMQYMQNVAH